MKSLGHVRTGGVLSEAVIIWAHVASYVKPKQKSENNAANATDDMYTPSSAMLTLPSVSVAVYVRVMTKSKGRLTLFCASLNVTSGVASQLSVAVAGPPVAAGVVAAEHSIDTSGGHVITGSVVSVRDIV